MTVASLFDPFQLGSRTLANRVVMAPLTRSRATADGVPTTLMEVYYAQRAQAGLIISEGVVVSPQAASFGHVPGLYNARQRDAWRKVVDAVHARGGLIFAQLWHVGRQSHSSVQPDGRPPWAPSSVPITGFRYYRKPDRLPYETPRELSREGIRQIIGDFADAATHAANAGFDGVELHGANGYLIDQFLNSGSNQRTDEYGGSIPNRARFLHELIDAVGERIPLASVGVRLSPSSTWMDAKDADKAALHRHVIASLNQYNLAYLHLVEPQIAGATTAEAAPDAVPTAWLSTFFEGPVIATGGHDLQSARQLLAEGTSDLVGFGRPFISNPDLPERLRRGAPLSPADRSLFYTGDADGYISYPSLADEQSWAELKRDLEAGVADPSAIHAQLTAHSVAELYDEGKLYSFLQLRKELSGTISPALQR